MPLLICAMVFTSVTIMVGLVVAWVVQAPRRAVRDRLLDRGATSRAASLAPGQPAPRSGSPWSWALGRKSKTRHGDLTVVGLKPDSAVAQTLLFAGYRSRGALRVFQFIRLLASQGLMGASLVVGKQSGAAPEVTLLWMAILGLVGFVAPKVAIRIKAKSRQHRLRLSLPDALDLLVICVEAGMGLNQAIVRVSDELQFTHPEISDEFRIVNLEIAAGRTRPQALRSLGERTGVDDIICLAAMIIQTDRFGTSIARSLRVHSDSLRTERRQRAEEAAAKTTIKLIFPLMFCVFPALMVMLLGPAALHLMSVFPKSFVR